MYEPHPHAPSGMDFGLMQVGILVLRLREGRTFSMEDVQYHMPLVKRWVHRRMRRTRVMGMDPVVENDSFSMFQRPEALVVRFTVTLGWEPAFLCYAEAFSVDPVMDPTTFANVVLHQQLKGHKVMVH